MKTFREMAEGAQRRNDSAFRLHELAKGTIQNIKAGLMNSVRVLLTGEILTELTEFLTLAKRCICGTLGSG